MSAADIPNLIRTLTDPILTRGPDGQGSYSSPDGRVGLVHTRLAIIDTTDRAAQPMGADQTVISFNGEIYNYRALRSELIARGVQFHSESDTEVILQGYALDGPDFFRRLRGMFAFLLFDPYRREVLAVRDPLGIKPLYFAIAARKVAFSSSPRAAAAASGRMDENPAAAVSTAIMGCVLEPLSMWMGVEALEPGLACVWSLDAGPTPVKRISIAPDFLWTGPTQPGDLDHLAAALIDTVQAHFTSDVPVAIFQSAGVDSVAFASVARHIGVRPTLLTIGFAEFEGTIFDEVPGAAATARRLGFEHRVWRVHHKDFLDIYNDFFAAMESPSADGVNSYLAARLAKREGFKVALSGLGGDELFAGYPSFTQLPRLFRMTQPFRHVLGRGLLSLFGWLAALDRRRSPKVRYFGDYADDFARSYLLRRAYFAPEETLEILDQDVVRAGLPAFWEAFNKQAGAALGHDAAAVGVLERDVYMRNVLLKDADWTGMAAGVEVRTPFVDSPFIRAVSDPEARISYNKNSLRALIQRWDPEADTSSRSKIGFVVPHHYWQAQGGKVETDLLRFGSAGPRLWNQEVLRRKFPDFSKRSPT